jgi:acetylornithine deacetylase
MLWPVHQELLALEARRNHTVSDPLFQGYPLPFPISVGVVRGGEWPSSVPDRVVIEGRFGLAPGEGEGEAQAALEEALVRATEREPWLRAHPPELEWWGGRFLPSRIPLEDPLNSILGGAFQEVLGRDANVEGVTFGSDVRLLVLEGGTPAVLFGPGDIRGAHGADESVAVAELETVLKVLALTTLRFCGCEDD